MKYFIPKGTFMYRFSTDTTVGEEIESTRKVVYTEEECIRWYNYSTGIYLDFKLPDSCEYEFIRVAEINIRKIR